MDHDFTNSQDLPDLPGLETVAVKEPSVPSLLFIGTIAGLAVVMNAWRYFDDHRPMHPIIIFIFLSSAVLSIYSFYRVLSGYLRYKTDSEGFAALGLLTSKAFKWDDVERIELPKPGDKIAALSLFTRNDKVTVTVRLASGAVDFSKLAASAWQHLRRRGKTDNVELTPLMLSLWQGTSAKRQEIPGEGQETPAKGQETPAGPSEILTWGKSPLIYAKLGNGLFLLMMYSMSIMLVIWTFGKQSFAPLAIMLGLLAAMHFLIRPVLLHQVEHLEVADSGLKVDLTFKSFSIPWSEISEASWVKGDLWIKFGSPKKQVWIPYSGSSMMTGKKFNPAEIRPVMTVIMQKLGAAGHAITLPPA